MHTSLQVILSLYENAFLENLKKEKNNCINYRTISFKNFLPNTNDI